MIERLKFAAALSVASMLGGSALAGCGNDKPVCHESTFSLSPDKLHIIVPKEGSTSKITYILQNQVDLVMIKATKQPDRKNINLQAPAVEVGSLNTTEPDHYSFRHKEAEATFKIVDPAESTGQSVEMTSRICES